MFAVRSAIQIQFRKKHIIINNKSDGDGDDGVTCKNKQTNLMC